MVTTRARAWVLGMALSVAAVSWLAPTALVEAQTPADRKRAKRAYNQARKAFAAKSFAEAAEQFKAAYDFDPKPGLLFNIGYALKEAGAFAEAKDYLERYLAEVPDARNAARVDSMLEELAPLVSDGTGNVMVQADVEGLDVFIDGSADPRCVTPCLVQLDAGEHEIVVTGEGREPDGRTIEVVAGETVTVALTPTAAVPMGSIAVNTSRKSGTVLLDGIEVAALPLADPVISEPGRRVVAIVDDTGREVWARSVEVPEGGSVAIDEPAAAPVAATSSTSGKTIAAWSLFGAGALSLAAGVFFGLAASDAETALDAQLSDGRTPDPDLIDQGESQALFANVFYGIGLVAIATGVVLYLLDDGPSESQDAARWWVPTVTTGEGVARSGWAF